MTEKQLFFGAFCTFLICSVSIAVVALFALESQQKQLRQIATPATTFTQAEQAEYDAAFAEAIRGLSARDGGGRYERNDALVARAHAIALEVVRTRAQRIPQRGTNP